MQDLTHFDMFIRLGASFIAGAIIGFERSSRRQVAGLRTHILICMGSTLLTLISIYLPQQYNPLKTSDPSRIAAQVVSGIGFLGAGAIIRLGNNVRGLTTAASLWFIAALGITIGAGMFVIAGVAIVFGLITLIFLYHFEKKLFPVKRLKLLEVYYKDSIVNTREVMDIIKSSAIEIQSIDVNQGSKSKGTRIRLLVLIPNTIDIAVTARSIKALPNVGKVEIKEKY